MNIPGFEIHRTLGAGGMATVYLAEQISLSREVALKIMAPDLLHADKSFCSRFIKEGRIIAKLRQEHVITIHDIGCIDGSTYFMSMEYCAGGTLKDRIKDGSAKAQTLPIIRQIASALGYAHSQGFVHRDIKPANILFRDDGSAVLSDFGIVKTISKTMDDRTQLTQAGFAIGTPEYMSPEQSAGKDLTGGADLYSLGVVLYEMLTGEKPFTGTDPLSTALQHAQKPIPRLPSEFLSLQPLLDSLLAKDVNERCPDAQHLIAEIDRLEHSARATPDIGATRMLSATSSPGGDAPTNVTIPLESTKKRKASGPALILGLMVLLGVGAWLWKLNERGAITPTAPPTVGETTESRGEPDRARILSPEQQRKVEHLLSIARAHIAMGRLQEPPGSNAYEAYELVLEIEPDNQEANENRAEIERLASKTD